jgi:aspartate/methionine/tyrosine aminotransferase
MRIEPFALERFQSVYEHQVEINLAESGVHPLTPGELLDDPNELSRLLNSELVYSQTNGTVGLREAIAALYPGATPDHVEVMNGGSEANFVVLWRLVEPGDDVVLMTPNYLQAQGLIKAFGGVSRLWRLRPVIENGLTRWRPDLDALDGLVGPGTKAIVICNPNNPTGARLDAPTLDCIATIAARHGTWLVSDEIYRGAELDGVETPSVWDRYERAIVTSGLSKAYGLPGLRIGWVVGRRDLVADFWAHHDYTTIGPGLLNDALARLALTSPRRERILERTTRILRHHYPIIRDWMLARPGIHHAPPEAGAIVLARYSAPVGSVALADRLRERYGLLVAPGDHFELDGHLRIGFGGETTALGEGLRRIGSALDESEA